MSYIIGFLVFIVIALLYLIYAFNGGLDAIGAGVKKLLSME